MISYVVLLLFVIGCTVNHSHAANFPLEIMNIKASGTGTPAISSTNRIFRAYPGVEYSIRAAVIGGTYPYTYALSNQPLGMTINSSTGEISWPNPQSNSGTITLSVTDSESNNVTATWAITVTTSGFIFVNSGYSGTETGSITQPYSSLSNMLNNSSTVSDIVYFRAGSYSLPIFNSTHYLENDCNLTNSPNNWIEYPGETATVDMDSHYFQGAGPYYFDGLSFTDVPDWFIHEVSSSNNYTTFRRLDISGARAVYRADNANHGLYYTSHDTRGTYLIFQDLILHSFDDVHGIGPLYEQNKVLVEDCVFYDFTSTLGGRPVIAPKWNGTSHTFRHNNIYNTNDRIAIGGGINGMFRGIEDIEILYNRISSATAIWFNNDGGSGVVAGDDLNPPTQRTTYIHRNTISGYIVIYNVVDGCGGSTGGPYSFTNNVITNSNTSGYTIVDYITYAYPTGSNPENCITDTNNLKGTSGLVDASGLLINRDYVGTYGWELGAGESDTTAPVVTAFTTPATSASLTVPISSFTATDAVGVTGYCINESATPPTSGSCSGSGWAGSAQTSFLFGSAGSKTLYAWAKDAAGNISDAATDGVEITLPVATLTGTSPGGGCSLY
jgi:hypothetical protein